MFHLGKTPLLPATKLREDNVFTPVCHFVHRVVCPGGLCLGDPYTVICRQYASYWNAFFLLITLHPERILSTELQILNNPIFPNKQFFIKRDLPINVSLKLPSFPLHTSLRNSLDSVF